MPVVLPPLAQGTAFDCGSTVCEAVLYAYKLIRRHKDMLARLGTTSLDGTDPRAIEAFLRSVGLAVQSGTMTIEDLKHHTRQHRAVICCVTHNGVGHYVGVTEVSRGRVHRMCPLTGIVAEPLTPFLSRWSDNSWLAPLHQWGIAAWRGSGVVQEG